MSVFSNTHFPEHSIHVFIPSMKKLKLGISTSTSDKKMLTFEHFLQFQELIKKQFKVWWCQGILRDVKQICVASFSLFVDIKRTLYCHDTNTGSLFKPYSKDILFECLQSFTILYQINHHSFWQKFCVNDSLITALYITWM